MKTWFTVKASAADAPIAASVEIFDELGYFGVTAKDFIDAIKPYKGKALEVAINSPGGDVFAGIAIYNALRAHGGEITTRVAGVAASAASIVLMAGDKRVAPENTMVMVHSPWTFAAGNAEELRDAADVLDKIGGTLVNVYVARTGKSEDEIRAMLAEDTWLTAEESLELGFIDEVVPSFEARACFDLDRLPEHVRAVFAKATPEPEPEPEVKPDTVTFGPEDIEAQAKVHDLTDFLPTFAADARIVDRESASRVMAEAAEIRAYARMAGLDDRAESLIKNRKSVAEARRALAEEMAALDAERHVDTAPPTKHKAAAETFSTTKLWADIKALHRSKQ